MLQLDQILGKERGNREWIYLYHDDKFWNAFEHSAYFFKEKIWPKIHVLVKTDRALGEYLRVGFPLTSLEKVRALVAEKAKLSWEEDLQLGQVRLGRFIFRDEVYSKWKSGYINLRAQAREELRPFYGGMPAYRAAYELMTLMIPTVRHLPAEFRANLGEALVEQILELVQGFRCFALKEKLGTSTKQQRLALLEDLQMTADKIAALLLLVGEEKVVGLERLANLAGQVGNLRKQLTQMEKKSQK